VNSPDPDDAFMFYAVTWRVSHTERYELTVALDQIDPVAISPGE
jgi:predicted solute-binding protein